MVSKKVFFKNETTFFRKYLIFLQLSLQESYVKKNFPRAASLQRRFSQIDQLSAVKSNVVLDLENCGDLVRSPWRWRVDASRLS